MTALLAIAALVAATGTRSAEGAQPRVPVFFLQGEQLAHVTRPGTTPLDAVQQLIAGPTRAELARGFRTYIPTGTRVLSVNVANGTATVDLNQRFASGGNADSLMARLSQLVRTLTGLQGATRVQLLMNGKVVTARFPGMSLGRPITFHYLQTPNVAVPRPPQERLPAPDASVKILQQRLIRLGLSGQGRRRRPLRTGDAERHPCFPEVGAARPDGSAGRSDEDASFDRDPSCSDQPWRCGEAR